MAGELVSPDEEETDPLGMDASADRFFSSQKEAMDPATPLQPVEQTSMDAGFEEVAKRRDRQFGRTVAASISGKREVNPDTRATVAAMAKEVNMRPLLGKTQEMHIRNAYLVKQGREILSAHPRLAVALENPEIQYLVHDDLNALNTVASIMRQMTANAKGQGFIENTVAFAKSFAQGQKVNALGAALAVGENSSSDPDVQAIALGGLLPGGLTKESQEAHVARTYNVLRGQMSPDEQITFSQLDEQGKAAYVSEHRDRLSGRTAAMAGLKKKADDAANELAYIVGTVGINDFARDAVLATANMIPSVLVSLAGAPQVGATLMAMQVFGPSYIEARKELSPGQALAEASFKALVEGLSEKIPLGMLTKPSRSTIIGHVKNMGAESLQEGFVDVVDQVYDLLIHDRSLPIDQAFNSVIRSMALGGTVGGALSIGIGGGRKLARMVSGADKREAQDFEKLVRKAHQSVADTKVLARSPESMREILAELEPGAEVYLPADKAIDLQQADNPILASDATTAETATEAALGGDVAVPVSALLTLPADQFNVLAPLIRQTVGAMNAQEAAEAVSEREEVVKSLLGTAQEIDAALVDGGEVEVVSSPRDQVRNEIFLDLVAAGTATTQDQAFTVAEVIADQFEAQAKLFKSKTALDLFKEQNLEIRSGRENERIIQEQMSQSSLTAPVITDPLAVPGEWEQVDVEALSLDEAGTITKTTVKAGEQFRAIAEMRAVSNDLMLCLKGG